MRDVAFGAAAPIIDSNMKRPYFREMIDMSSCTIEWQHNIPLGTPIYLTVPTRKTVIDDEIFYEIDPYKKARLDINGTKFNLKNEDYAFMFMPIGINESATVESPDKFSDIFDYSNYSGIFNILSSIGAMEVSDFQITLDDENIITYIKNSKLIQEGLSDPIPEGWVSISESSEEQIYCYAPMTDYIIWGDIDSEDLKIMVY